MCVLLFVCASQEGGGWRWGLLLMPQCNHRTSERQRRMKWYLKKKKKDSTGGYNSFVYSILPYGPFWMENEKRKKKKRSGKGGIGEGGGQAGRVGRQHGGADGIGKMRGKREGETDILETGRRASAGAARFMN